MVSLKPVDGLVYLFYMKKNLDLLAYKFKYIFK